MHIAGLCKVKRDLSRLEDRVTALESGAGGSGTGDCDCDPQTLTYIPSTGTLVLSDDPTGGIAVDQFPVTVCDAFGDPRTLSNP